MLYLIKSGSNLKIGFTSDLDSRLSQYKVHNPDIRLLNYKSGTREDEKRLHTLCKNINILMSSLYITKKLLIYLIVILVK